MKESASSEQFGGKYERIARDFYTKQFMVDPPNDDLSYQERPGRVDNSYYKVD